MARKPVRYLQSSDRDVHRPIHAVWELTLACDLKCVHCGSRAQKARPEELSTEEALDLVSQLARMGCREVTLIGGEAYLRKDWTQIIAAIAGHGMKATLQSGARNLTAERLKAAREAGLAAVGVSIDGLEPLHDALRGVPGSFRKAVAALRAAHALGLSTCCNTQITSKTASDLPELMELLVEVGVQSWQIQLTVAMGRAADRPELLVQPYDLLSIMPLLYRLYTEAKPRGLLLIPGNNIGYFGPYEAEMRGAGRDDVHFASCNAGQNTLGIEADGSIKGCPSLPTRDYVGGKITEMSLEEIWNDAPALAFTRERTNADLWGFCKSCYYADVCRAGCTWTTHVLFGRPGNNPFCHHRALELEKEGLRERVVQTRRAPGLPFDQGEFELVLEPIGAAPEAPPRRGRLRVLD